MKNQTDWIWSDITDSRAGPKAKPEQLNEGLLSPEEKKAAMEKYNKLKQKRLESDPDYVAKRDAEKKAASHAKRAASAKMSAHIRNQQKNCHHHFEEIDTHEDETGAPPYDQCIHCGKKRY